MKCFQWTAGGHKELTLWEQHDHTLDHLYCWRLLYNKHDHNHNHCHWFCWSRPSLLSSCQTCHLWKTVVCLRQPVCLELIIWRFKRLVISLSVFQSELKSLLFPSVPWHCWFGNRKGIRPVKNWMLVRWWWFDWSFAQPIAPVVQLSPPPPSSFASLNTANPGSPGKSKRERIKVPPDC